jgi:hypothetical protein
MTELQSRKKVADALGLSLVVITEDNTSQG